MENTQWARILVKEFYGSIESGLTKRNAILKTEEPGMALPVESLCFPHRHRHDRIDPICWYISIYHLREQCACIILQFLIMNMGAANITMLKTVLNLFFLLINENCFSLIHKLIKLSSGTENK